MKRMLLTGFLVVTTPVLLGFAAMAAAEWREVAQMKREIAQVRSEGWFADAQSIVP